MPAARPLRIPTKARLRREFLKRKLPIPELLSFMEFVANREKSIFFAYTLASELSRIATMRSDLKIKYLDNLMEEVNFPRWMREEINLVIDLIEPPPDYVEAAERVITSLENLTGVMVQPNAGREPVRAGVYQDVVAAFKTVRGRFVYDVAHAFIGYSAAHISVEEEFLDFAITRIIERLEEFGRIAVMCNDALQTNTGWMEETVTRVQVIGLLNESKVRDKAVQDRVDNQEEVGRERIILATIDELIITHCEQAMLERTNELQTIAFWREVLKKAPGEDSG